MPSLIHSILQNKVIGYMASRYVTYAIQFVNSICIAVVLGPMALAVWGFINLVLQYAAQINFGIPHSLNVFLSLNKNDEQRAADCLRTSLFLYLLLAAGFLLFLGIAYGFDLRIGEKYDFPRYAVVVFLIAVLTHFNTLFTNYFRIKNRLFEILFFQSVVPVLTLLALIFIADPQVLLHVLLGIMLSGQVLATVLFLRKMEMPLFKRVDDLGEQVRKILRKGMYLFIYNACFYFIIISTRSVVSSCYDVIEFGYFTFSFTLANAVMLLFDSFSFLIYPKTINRLNVADKEETVRIVNVIRDNYVIVIHLIMYFFILFFPLVLLLFPAYQAVFKCFGLIMLTVVFYTNCFAYSSILIARQREKIIAGIAFVALCLNILLALIIVYVFRAGYEYVIIATLSTYIVYNILLTLFAHRIVGIRNTFRAVIYRNFDPGMFVPFVLCFVCLVTGVPYFFYAGVLLLFVFLNWKKICLLKDMFFKIIYNPHITNI